MGCVLAGCGSLREAGTTSAPSGSGVLIPKSSVFLYHFGHCVAREDPPWHPLQRRGQEWGGCGCNWNQAPSSVLLPSGPSRNQDPPLLPEHQSLIHLPVSSVKFTARNTSSLWENKILVGLLSAFCPSYTPIVFTLVGQTCETLVPWPHWWKCHWNIKGRIASWVWSQ